MLNSRTLLKDRLHGIDNDGDGRADYPTDPGCAGPDDTDEADPDPAPGSVQTVLRVDSDWGSGYCATVEVRNSGGAAQIWQVSLDIEGQVTGLWNAVYAQAGSRLDAHGVDWNQSVPAGGVRQFGFCASR